MGLVLATTAVQAQQPDSTAAPLLRYDTLQDVRVTAYGNRGAAFAVPAAIGTVGSAALARTGDASVLAAINTVPGVRMEERSPGSYRLGIRGSALEAPFGVRNIKVYYNGIPLTDPGGTTYLNALGFYNFGALEVLRGPGSSVYGAGTGGVVLVHSNGTGWRPGAEAVVTGGSYGLFHAAGAVWLGDSSTRHTLRYQHLQSEGYRQQSALRRDVASWDAHWRAGSRVAVGAHALYSDLAYETPGALTRAEYDRDPSLARPRVGATPGAVEAAAAIRQQLALAGVNMQYSIAPGLAIRSVVYATLLRQENPGVRNYSVLSSPHTGGRVEGSYQRQWGATELDVLAGGELQQSFSTAQVFSNRGGQPDTLQALQDAVYRQATAFLQATLRRGGWVLTAGGSANAPQVRLRSGYRPAGAVRNIRYQAFAPRVALLRDWKHTALWASVSRGFSPPPLDAVAPTGSPVNAGLVPATGWSYEIGWRQAWLDRRLLLDVTAFYFRLEGAVIPRRDSAGGDTYTNAGSTRQPGIEAALSYGWTRGWLGGAAQLSYTGHYFRYDDFQPAGQDYSGNRYPGVAPHTVSAGLTLYGGPRWTLGVNALYSAAFSINDANTAQNDAYLLVGTRLAYRVPYRRSFVTVFAGIDNALNETYSLGPDLNAAGGRYYNAAAPRNAYGGLQVRLDRTR